jgi:putative sigma-54 modulation protein
MIKIHIRELKGDVAEVLRNHVERRLRFALGRFADRIGRVKVRFSSVSGRLRGGSKRCQIHVGLRPIDVQVEDTNTDAFAAVDHAVDRVSRSVARALERERAWDAVMTPPRRPGVSRA